MFKHILVPLDGSEFSERAIPVAKQLAAETGGQLALIRVVEVVAPGEHEPGVISYLDEHRVATAQEYMARVALRIGSEDLTADTYLAPDAATGIIGRALDNGAGAIVMTTHGTSWPAAGHLGSVAARLIAESPIPVIVVGPGAMKAVEVGARG